MYSARKYTENSTRDRCRCNSPAQSQKGMPMEVMFGLRNTAIEPSLYLRKLTGSCVKIGSLRCGSRVWCYSTESGRIGSGRGRCEGSTSKDCEGSPRRRDFVFVFCLVNGSKWCCAAPEWLYKTGVKAVNGSRAWYLYKT